MFQSGLRNLSIRVLGGQTDWPGRLRLPSIGSLPPKSLETQVYFSLAPMCGSNEMQFIPSHQKMHMVSLGSNHVVLILQAHRSKSCEGQVSSIWISKGIMDTWRPRKRLVARTVPLALAPHVALLSRNVRSKLTQGLGCWVSSIFTTMKVE